MGLKFTHVRRQVEVDFLELPNIFQKAFNIEHHIGERLYMHSVIDYTGNARLAQVSHSPKTRESFDFPKEINTFPSPYWAPR